MWGGAFGTGISSAFFFSPFSFLANCWLLIIVLLFFFALIPAGGGVGVYVLDGWGRLFSICLFILFLFRGGVCNNIIFLRSARARGG